ncbi:BRO family protein [Bacillus sp. C1]
MNDLQIFESELGQVRTICQGETVWFVAKDVCDILELNDTNKALLALDDDEKSKHEQYSGSGRKPMIINESGLYSLILRSRKPQAKAFRKWITSEVIPNIRKEGGYLVTTEEDDTETIIARALILAQKTIEKKTKQLERAQQVIEEQAPLVEYVNEVLSTENFYTATEIAKSLGLRSPQELYNRLVEKKIIYKSRKKNYLHRANYEFLRSENYIRYETNMFGLTMMFSEKGRYWIAQELGIINK